MPFLYAQPMASADEEDQRYQNDVDSVKQWWKDSRWRYTRRPFTAEQIVAKRGNIKIEHPSNIQSKKLWQIIEGRFKVYITDHTRSLGTDMLMCCQNGEASFTYGCLEPTALTQMAKYLDTVYVSGWQCSSTASSSDEPGPDLADYPMVGITSMVVEYHS